MVASAASATALASAAAAADSNSIFTNSPDALWQITVPVQVQKWVDQVLGCQTCQKVLERERREALEAFERERREVYERERERERREAAEEAAAAEELLREIDYYTNQVEPVGRFDSNSSIAGESAEDLDESYDPEAYKRMFDNACQSFASGLL